MTDWPSGTSEMARRIRAHDWASTPLGPIEHWSPTQKSLVDSMLASSEAVQLAFGKAGIVLYNDAFAPLLGPRHPGELGRPLHESSSSAEGSLAPPAEVASRESVERQEFLLRLSDRLRAETGVEAVGNRAVRMIADRLAVDRVYLATLSPGDDNIAVTHEARREGMVPLKGSYRAAEFPSAMTEVFERTIVYNDVRTHPSLSEVDRLSFAGVGVVGFAAVPIRRGNEAMICGGGAVSTQPRAWTPAEIELLENAVERTWAAVEAARAEAALKDSEARFQQFARASAAALWIRDAKSMAMEYVSPAISNIYGLAQDSLLGGLERWAVLIVPEDRDFALQCIERARQGEAAVHEFRIQRPSDRAFRWIRNTDFPLFDAEGRVQRIGGIAEDVTQAKLGLEHQSVLLAELQHRVRNIMAVIRSIAHRTAGGARSVEAYQSLLEGRLLALARVQTLLTREANAGGSMLQIIESETSAQAPQAAQISLVGPDVRVSPKAAEVLTLAVHELATNALKHGAFSVAGGRLSVSWSTFEKRGGSWLSLDWVETGVTPRLPITRRGFGSDLIEGRIPYELGGVAAITIDHSGARCHLEFPLDDRDSILETDAPLAGTIFGGALDMPDATALAGRRVLVVEDDYYLASDTAAALRRAGAEVLLPCPTEAAALDLLERERPTHAVVDLNLGDGPRFEIARVLKERGVPFIFLIGYDPDVVPADFSDVVQVQKPIPFRKVVEALAEL